MDFENTKLRMYFPMQVVRYNHRWVRVPFNLPCITRKQCTLLNKTHGLWANYVCVLHPSSTPQRARYCLPRCNDNNVLMKRSIKFKLNQYFILSEPNPISLWSPLYLPTPISIFSSIILSLSLVRFVRETMANQTIYIGVTGRYVVNIRVNRHDVNALDPLSENEGACVVNYYLAPSCVI